MALIMAAANLAVTTTLSPLEKGSIRVFEVVIVDPEADGSDEDCGSNELFLPGWRPQAAM